MDYIIEKINLEKKINTSEKIDDEFLKNVSEYIKLIANTKTEDSKVTFLIKNVYFIYDYDKNELKASIIPSENFCINIDNDKSIKSYFSSFKTTYFIKDDSLIFYEKRIEEINEIFKTIYIFRTNNDVVIKALKEKKILEKGKDYLDSPIFVKEKEEVIENDFKDEDDQDIKDIFKIIGDLKAVQKNGINYSNDYNEFLKSKEIVKLVYKILGENLGFNNDLTSQKKL